MPTVCSVGGRVGWGQGCWQPDPGRGLHPGGCGERGRQLERGGQPGLLFQGHAGVAYRRVSMAVNAGAPGGSLVRSGGHGADR